jgi:hypothetical protein
MTFQTKVKELLSTRQNKAIAAVTGAAIILSGALIGDYASKATECEKAEAVLISQLQHAIARNTQFDQLNAKAEETREQMEEGGLFVMMALMGEYKEMSSQLYAISDAYEAETNVYVATRDQYQSGKTCKLENRRNAFKKMVETQYLPHFQNR